MIKKYFSNYTGKQIDEAVKAIIDNQITLEDLSPELVQEIKNWIHEGVSSTTELRFHTHYEFPNIGEEKVLYIATDEDRIYYWKDLHYVPMKGDFSQIDYIVCGGAQEDGTKN